MLEPAIKPKTAIIIYSLKGLHRKVLLTFLSLFHKSRWFVWLSVFGFRVAESVQAGIRTRVERLRYYNESFRLRVLYWPTPHFNFWHLQSSWDFLMTFLRRSELHPNKTFLRLLWPLMHFCSAFLYALKTCLLRWEYGIPGFIYSCIYPFIYLFANIHSRMLLAISGEGGQLDGSCCSAWWRSRIL